MRWCGVLLFLLLFSVSAPGQDISVDQATLDELKLIFVTQQLIVNDLSADLQRVEAQLKSLRALSKQDSKEYKRLKSDYNALSREHARATSLLQDLNQKLKQSQDAQRALANSLHEANESLKSSWLRAGAMGAAVGSAATLLAIVIIQN